ncbi:MAG TPA: TolC family protein [Bdellovibrionota bacterium]|nr:TolC family protein [Bdellovibrionota bacterium]
MDTALVLAGVVIFIQQRKQPRPFRHSSKRKRMKGALLSLFVWVGVPMLSLGPSADANADAPPPAALRDVLEIAKQRNPEIAAAQKRWESARAQISVARSIPDLEFGVEYEGINQNTFDFGSAMETWYRVGQTIPFPSKLVYKGRAASFAAQREEAAYRTAERDVFARVKESYYALMFADRSVQISKENVEILRKFTRIAASRYGVGKTSQSDVLRAQVELSKANNMVVTLEQELQTVQARLNALLDRKPNDPFGPLEEPRVLPLNKTYAEMESIALKERPEIRGAQRELEKMQAEVGAMKSEFLPDLQIEYGWRDYGGSLQAQNDSSVLFKLNVPLWFWRQKSQVSSAQSERQRAAEMLRGAQAATRSEIQEFFVHVDTARRLVELYLTTLLPQAEQSLRVAEAAYQSDRVDFLNLLDSDRTLIDFRLEYYRYLAEYGRGTAHLERVLGVDSDEFTGGRP